MAKKDIAKQATVVTIQEVEQRIVTLRGQKMMFDADLAMLYGVTTKEVNQAVKNNPEKFPNGCLYEIDNKELASLRSKILTTNEDAQVISVSSKSRVRPKAFTEKGIYMLATILKSERATQTTLAIIDAFVKLRELQTTISAVQKADNEQTQKSLLQRSGEIVSDLIGASLETEGAETEIELNLAVLKIKHTIKRKK